MRVSVLMSSFNHERFIERAMASVLDQRFTDFEFIIRDDGSLDRCPELIAAQRDPRIRYLGTGRNLGGAESLNECLRQARGEFIAIINSDDEFLPDKLATQVAYLEAHPGCAAVFGQASVITEDGAPLNDADHPFARMFRVDNLTRHQWLRRFLLKGNCLCHPTILIRRSCYDTVGLYDPAMAQLPDFDMWIRLCAHYDIHVLPEELICFRVLGNDNASALTPQNSERMHYEQIILMQQYLREPILSQIREILPEAGLRPDHTRREAWLALAPVALARQTPGHQFLGLECLRLANEELPREDRDYPAYLRAVHQAKPFSSLRLPGDAASVKEPKLARRIEKMEAEMAKLRKREAAASAVADRVKRHWLGRWLVPSKLKSAGSPEEISTESPQSHPNHTP